MLLDKKNQPVFVLFRLDPTADQQSAMLLLKNWLPKTPFELISWYKAFNPDQLEQIEDRKLQLTRADIDLVRALSEGKTNKEIAQIQSRKLDTVASHLKRLFKKMGVRSRSEAVAMGFRDSMI